MAYSGFPVGCPLKPPKKGANSEHDTLNPSGRLSLMGRQVRHHGLRVGDLSALGACDCADPTSGGHRPGKVVVIHPVF